MATYWVDPTKDDDTGNGETLGTAKKNIYAGLALLTTKGDILNLVNSASHEWTPAANEVIINDGAGTDFVTDPGYTIRGRSTSDTPAMTTVVSSSAIGTRAIAYFQNGSGYNIFENLIFDATATHAESVDYTVVRMSGNSVGPILFRYCSLLAAPTGTVPADDRSMLEVVDPPSSIETFQIRYCYFQNAVRPIRPDSGYGGDLLVTTISNCVFINDADVRAYAIFNQGSWIGDDLNVVTFTNNTIYESIGNNDTHSIFLYGGGPGNDIGSIACHSNFIWQETEATLNPFMSGGTATTTTGTSRIISPNVLIGGPSVTSGDLGAQGWYGQMWDANLDDVTAPDTHPTDVVVYETADTTVFNDPSSTYDWVMPNGLTITILKDLRPILYTTNGLYGTRPGALPVVADDDDDDVTDPNDPAAIAFIDTYPLYAPDLQYSINARLSTERNRNTDQYLRKDIENARWTEMVTRQIALAASGTVTVNLGGVAMGKNLLVESDVAMQVTLDSITYPSATSLVLITGSFETMSITNASATDEAAILLVVTD